MDDPSRPHTVTGKRLRSSSPPELSLVPRKSLYPNAKRARGPHSPGHNILHRYLKSQERALAVVKPIEFGVNGEHNPCYPSPDLPQEPIDSRPLIILDSSVARTVSVTPLEPTRIVSDAIISRDPAAAPLSLQEPHSRKVSTELRWWLLIVVFAATDEALADHAYHAAASNASLCTFSLSA
jgi:hypothetical protein